VEVPDLAEYRLHRVTDEARVDGVALPGLSAAFYRRTGVEVLWPSPAAVRTAVGSWPPLAP
jgi:hypothetical protein